MVKNAAGLALTAVMALMLVVTMAIVIGQSVDDSENCLPTSGTAAIAAEPLKPSAKAGFTVAPSEAYREGQTVQTQTFTVTDAMLRNVATVARVAGEIWPTDPARRDRAILIATSIGMVETTLENRASRAVPETLAFPHDAVSEDHDSAGFFQQRVNQGYHGTAAQIMNVEWAASMFFGRPKPDAPSDRDWGLADYQRVKGVDWLTEDPALVAANIQRPAERYRYRYGLWLRDAPKVIQAASGISVDAAPGGAAPCPLPAGSLAGGVDCGPPAGRPVERGLTADALLVLTCVQRQWPQLTVLGIGDRPATVDDDHQTGRALDVMVPDPAAGDQVAEWALKSAPMLGVKYIIWNTRIWSAERAEEGWRQCGTAAASCYAGPDRTQAHRDHVHISVLGNAATPAGGNGGPVGAATAPLARGRYIVGSRFGAVGSWQRYHTGQDLSAPIGTPIMAAAGGRVEVPNAGGWAGVHVIVRHADGSATLYAHMAAATVQPGATVQAGQRIGIVGMTGRTFGPHLHFEHYPAGASTSDVYVADDPAKWLRSMGVTL